MLIMKNLINLFLLIFFILPTFSSAQEFIALRMIGSWDVEFTKSDPENVLEELGQIESFVSTWELTPDEKGVIVTNKVVAGGQEYLTSFCHFYDPEKHEMHSLGSFGTALTTCQDDQNCTMKQYNFQGGLLNTQIIEFISETELKGVQIDEVEKTKVWSKWIRKE